MNSFWGSLFRSVTYEPFPLKGFLSKDVLKEDASLQNNGWEKQETRGHKCIILVEHVNNRAGQCKWRIQSQEAET